jgi:hypothetical protein
VVRPSLHITGRSVVAAEKLGPGAGCDSYSSSVYEPREEVPTPVV